MLNDPVCQRRISRNHAYVTDRSPPQVTGL